MFIPFLLRRANFLGITYESSGQIGDTFGGILGPLVGFAGVLTTFAAFYLQHVANKEQTEQFDKQDSDLKVERFENVYFELIKLHRENVAEMKVGEFVGRKVFVKMLREFREVLKFTKQACETYNLTSLQQIDIAYLTFYYGLGPNSTRILKSALAGYPDEIISCLIEKISNEHLKRKVSKERKLYYRPFGGHQSRLGHYFRHLYQTIKYVHEREVDIDKYQYIKILRAQLSNHEQALLMFNSLSRLGNVWGKENLISKYRLIKNIPKEFIDNENEIDVKSLFPDVTFEWEETN